MTKCQRYIVFAGDTYYPGGGWDDLVGTYATLEEAKAAAADAKSKLDWAEIIDFDTGEPA